MTRNAENYNPRKKGLKYFTLSIDINDHSKVENEICSFDELHLEMQKALLERYSKRKRWEEKYGNIKNLIYSINGKIKLVAVGNYICYSDKWRTFHDFLFDYPLILLGKEWCENELNKSSEDKHIIIQWYENMINYIKVKGDPRNIINQTEEDTYSMLYLLLSYDLFVVRHNASLQEELIKRLKNKNLFQGARYELFAITNCIRGGLDIKYIKNKNKGKKPEFIGIHEETGIEIAVEAKSMHRDNVLGFKGGEDTEENKKMKFREVIWNAYGQQMDFPCILFIDVNLPYTNQETINVNWTNEVNKAIDNLITKKSLDYNPYNLRLLQNSYNFI